MSPVDRLLSRRKQASDYIRGFEDRIKWQNEEIIKIDAEIRSLASQDCQHENIAHITWPFCDTTQMNAYCRECNQVVEPSSYQTK